MSNRNRNRDGDDQQQPPQIQGNVAEMASAMAMALRSMELPPPADMGAFGRSIGESVATAVATAVAGSNAQAQTNMAEKMSDKLAMAMVDMSKHLGEVLKESVERLGARAPQQQQQQTGVVRWKPNTLYSHTPHDWMAFRVQFEEGCKLSKYSKDDSISLLRCSMGGKAFGLTHKIVLNECQTLAEALDLYESRFVPVASKSAAVIQCTEAVQHEEETVTEFHARLWSLYLRAYPETTDADRKLELMAHFLKGQGVHHPHAFDHLHRPPRDGPDRRSRGQRNQEDRPLQRPLGCRHFHFRGRRIPQRRESSRRRRPAWGSFVLLLLQLRAREEGLPLVGDAPPCQRRSTPSASSSFDEGDSAQAGAAAPTGRVRP